MPHSSARRAESPHSRLLVWLGPGAHDRGAWSWATSRACLGVVAPERTERFLSSRGCAVEDGAAHPEAARSRGFLVRDGHLVGTDARRRLRSLMGPQALVVQIVREPVTALRAEVQRARLAAITAKWAAPRAAGSAARSLQLPTAESLYDHLLPRLRLDRRGRAFTPAGGRRLVLDRDELHDPRSLRLRCSVEDWLGADARSLAWESCEPRRDHDFTETLELASTGPIEAEGARVMVRLTRADELSLRPDLVELARVPSIAARVAFPVDDAALALVTPLADFHRLPRGVRQALTATGVFQHRLEEQWLPRWIERTAQIHHELGDELPVVTPRLAARLRMDLAEDLERLFALRPTLEGRWSMLMHRALAR